MTLRIAESALHSVDFDFIMWLHGNWIFQFVMGIAGRTDLSDISAEIRESWGRSLTFSKKIHPAADFASCIMCITLTLSLCIQPRMQNQQLQALHQQALQMQLQQNAMQQTAMQQNAMSMSTQMPQNTSQSSTSSMQVPQTQLQVPQLQSQMRQQMPPQSPQMTQMGQQPLQQLQQAPVQLPPLACTKGAYMIFKEVCPKLFQAFFRAF